MDWRAQPAERRLIVYVGPRRFEDRLPRADSGGQPAARQPAETLPQHAGGDDLTHGQPQHQHQHGHGQRLERLFPPEGQRRAEAAANQGRRQRDREHPGDLPVGDAPEKRREQEDRQRGRQQHQHRQQAGQQFAQNQFAIREIRQQQQHERLAVLLVSHFTRRQQRREKSRQRQLQRRENLKQGRGEAGQIAQIANQLRARQHQPRRTHQHQQPQRIGRPGEIEFDSPWSNRHFTRENRTDKQRSSPAKEASNSASHS